MTNDTEVSSLLDADQVAAMLNVSRALVYRLVLEGSLEVIRIGRRLRFDPETVRTFVTSQRRVVDLDERDDRSQ